MRNSIKLLTLSCAIFVAFGTSSCEKEQVNPIEPTPPAEVIIPDEKLRNAIKAALNLDASATINVENILLLDTLDINGRNDLTGEISGIAALTGLAAATELVYLNFGATAVTDLAPIAGLRKVKYLRLNTTAVTDLSPISQYTTLIYFNANSTTGITDISPLAGNAGLQEAILRGVPFGNAGMSTIAGLTALYRLNMRSTAVTDISVLGTLMSNGTLLDTTPGANEAGGATLDLRGLTVDCTILDPYRSQISNLDGC